MASPSSSRPYEQQRRAHELLDALLVGDTAGLPDAARVPPPPAPRGPDACRPWSRDDYMARLRSLVDGCASDLVGGLLSPALCARYGWRHCPDPAGTPPADRLSSSPDAVGSGRDADRGRRGRRGGDWLECTRCHARLHAVHDAATAPVAVAAAARAARCVTADRMARELQLAHHRFCPWRDNPTPRRVADVPLGTADAARTRAAALLATCEPDDGTGRSGLVRVEPASLLRQLARARHGRQLLLPATATAHGDAADDAAHVLAAIGGALLPHIAPSSPRYPQALAASALALCGWRGGSPDGGAGTLVCDMCCREVGVWNFAVFPGPQLAVAGAASGHDDGVPAKRCRRDVATDRPFDPIQQHRRFCPWIVPPAAEVDAVSDPSMDEGGAVCALFDLVLSGLAPRVAVADRSSTPSPPAAGATAATTASPLPSSSGLRAAVRAVQQALGLP